VRHPDFGRWVLIVMTDFGIVGKRNDFGGGRYAIGNDAVIGGTILFPPPIE
jgi:hypothetical protein